MIMTLQKRNYQDGITMIKGYQTEILKIYDNIRDYESKALKARKDEISEKYPEIIDIDNKIQKLSLKMALAVLKSSDSDKTLHEIGRAHV